MKSKTKIYIIIPATFILISLLLAVFLIWPAFAEIKKNSDETILQNGRENFIDEQNKEMENFKSNYKSYQPNLEKIDRLFIDPQNPVDFINFLENTTSETGVKSDISLAFLPASKSKPVSMPFVSFRISSKGEFLNILKFSNKLELGPYLVEIKNMEIKEEKGAGKDTAVLRADFLINVFTK
ncbi:MAG: hypothetical protein AAB352_04085 [Patescibacteria group bacterium]